MLIRIIGIKCGIAHKHRHKRQAFWCYFGLPYTFSLQWHRLGPVPMRVWYLKRNPNTENALYDRIHSSHISVQDKRKSANKSSFPNLKKTSLCECEHFELRFVHEVPFRWRVYEKPIQHTKMANMKKYECVETRQLILISNAYLIVPNFDHGALNLRITHNL